MTCSVNFSHVLIPRQEENSNTLLYMHSRWFIKHLLIKAIHFSQVNNAIQSVININSELVKSILFMENLWLETRRLQSFLNRPSRTAQMSEKEFLSNLSRIVIELLITDFWVMLNFYF